MEMPKATEEHRWLEQLVGRWTYESVDAGPEDCASAGVETVRMLGDFWLIAEAEGEAGGQPATHVITVGFDPQKGKFFGSFVTSMMPSFWIYEGTLDADGKALRLKSEGPRFDGQPGTAMYEDSIEIISPDEHLFRGRAQQDDGSWKDFMVTRYRRA